MDDGRGEKNASAHASTHMNIAVVLVWPLSTRSYCPFEPLMWPFICLAHSFRFLSLVRSSSRSLSRFLSLSLCLFHRYCHWLCWFIHLMFRFESMCLFVCLFVSFPRVFCLRPHFQLCVWVCVHVCFHISFALLSFSLSRFDFHSVSLTSNFLINPVCRIIAVVVVVVADVHTQTAQHSAHIQAFLILIYDYC